MILHALVTDIEPAAKVKEVCLPSTHIGQVTCLGALTRGMSVDHVTFSLCSRQAMNEINAARRLRVAAAENAEAHKVSGTRAKNEGEGRKIDLSRSMEAVHVF